jgi:hypothetical protein
MLTLDFGTATQIAHHVSVVLGALVMLACIFVVLRQGQAGIGVFLFALMGGALLAFSLWRGVEIESEGLRTLNEVRTLQVEASARLNRLAADLLSIEDRVNQGPRTTPPTRTASAPGQAEPRIDRERRNETILVFHTTRSARDAALIVRQLLNAGYASASAVSEALEADVLHRPGAVRIVYSDGAHDSASAVARIAREAGMANRWIDDPVSGHLRVGDVEVHLF